VNDVVYLYGFVPADAPAPPPTLVGVGDAPVELLAVDGTNAVIARLPADEYARDQVDARLEDLRWVGEQGLAHERVVLWFVDRTDILPTRLFSLYSGESVLREALAARAPGIAAQLRRFAGRCEWNLKVAYDPDRLGRHGAEVSEELGRLDAEIRAAPPGRRYLLERKRADVQKRELGRSARRLAGELLDALRPLADAALVLPLATAEDTGTVVLSAALLVPRAVDGDLRAEAERRTAELAELGMDVTFSGPWAPYRFLEDDVAAG
jgi:hypothetical protein